MRIKIVAITFFGIFNCIISSSHPCAAAEKEPLKEGFPALQDEKNSLLSLAPPYAVPEASFQDISRSSSPSSEGSISENEWSESNPAHPDYSPAASPFPYLDYLILQVQSDETISAK